MSIRSIVVAAALLVAACGDSPPTCEEMATHVEALAKKESAIELAPRDALIANCKAELATNEKLRICVGKATSLEHAKSCELEAAFEQLNR